MCPTDGYEVQGMPLIEFEIGNYSKLTFDSQEMLMYPPVT